MSSNIPKQDAQVSSNIAKDQSFRLVSEPPGAVSDEKGRTAVIIRPAGSRINTIKVWLFFGLYIAIITILLVFFFYFLFGNAVDQQRIYSVLNSVSKIMKDPPIADFYATNNTCLFDYDPVSLGQWPGIEHGCYYTEEKTVKIGNCNQEKKGLGVQTIPGETINTWQGYTFCIRKYHSIAIEYDGDCPYGFQKCGRYLCVLEQEKCPITSITWVDGVPANDTTEEIVSADTVNQHYFKIQRSAAKEPLVAFSISYNGMPCLDTISIPYPEQNYPLLSAKPGCRYGQNFETVTINSLPEPNFFSSLSAYDRVKSLPLIDEYSLSGTAYLVGLNRFRVKPDPTCSNPEQFFIMGRVNDAADKITRLRTLFLITVLFGVVIILFLSCDQRKTSAGISSVDLSMREKNGQFIFVLCILLSLLTLCCMLIVKPYVQLIKSYRDSLQVYSQNKCFMNNFITTALTDFANGPPYEAALFYQIIIVIGCLSLVPILLMIYEKCKPKPDPKDILIKNPDDE